jgi:hypothetical protein
MVAREATKLPLAVWSKFDRKTGLPIVVSTDIKFWLVLVNTIVSTPEVVGT